MLQEGVNATRLSMAVQTDGKLVLSGEVTNQAFMAKDIAQTRLLSNGLVDASFGTNGRVQFGPFLFDQPRAVAIQEDGKIVIGGHMVSGVLVNFMVARLNADGSRDGTFGFGGVNVMDFAGGDDLGAAMALAPDGRIVVAGNVRSGGRFLFGVARFNTDGTPDDTFGQQAGRTIDNMGRTDRLNAIALAPNGLIYAAGSRDVPGNPDFAVAQYLSNGTLAGCGAPPCGNWPTGKMFVDFGGSDTANAIDVRGDGRIAVAGRGNGLMAWAEFGPQSTSVDHLGLTDSPGSSEGAFAVQFTGFENVVVAGYHTFGGYSNFAAARVLAAYPNPLAGRSMITFALSGEALVQLRIYDVAGRLVRKLTDERLAAGQHARAWDGTDDGGRRVAAGVYFCRPHAGGTIQRQPLVVLR